jgi:plastocyanin
MNAGGAQAALGRSHAGNPIMMAASMARALALTLIIAAPLAAACGSSSPTGATQVTDGAGHAMPLTVMILPTGMSPDEVTVAVGDRVGFMNHDTVPRQVAGGPDAAKPECPEIDAVGRIIPGEIRSTAPLPTARTCEYHVQSTAFKGRIVIR